MKKVIALCLLWLAALCTVGSNAAKAADAKEAESPSALGADSQGWSDILPRANLEGWYRLMVQSPAGSLTAG